MTTFHPQTPKQAEIVSQSIKTSPRRRWWRWGIVLLLAISLLPYLLSRYSTRSNRIHLLQLDPVTEPTQIKPPGTIKILTYNIAHGRGATDNNWQEPGSEKLSRISEIAKFLKNENADVVILNEVDFNSTWSGGQNQARAIAKQAGYAYCVEQRNLDFQLIYGSWQFGNAILSKHPITNAQVVNLPPEKSWEDWLVGCKRGVVCQIQPLGQSKFRVMAVHLEHRSESVRAASAKLILNLAENGSTPLIAAGDFNSTPQGFPQSHQKSENAMDLIIAAKQFQVIPQTPPTTTEMTFNSTQPKSTIDWILIPNDWQVLTYKVIDTKLSDHRPVVAVIKPFTKQNGGL